MTEPTEMDARERLTLLWMEAEPVVRAFVFASIQCFADAEDVVQKVALNVARRFDEYDDKRPFQAWALWLAKSRVIDHYRVKGREKVLFSEPILEGLAQSLITKQPTQTARAAALEVCIDKLPEKSKKLMKLKYEDGASAIEIAEIFKSSAASVRVLLHRVRNILGDCINLELQKEAR